MCRQTHVAQQSRFILAQINLKNYLDILLNEKSIKAKAPAVKKPTAAKSVVEASVVSEKSTAAKRTKMATGSKALTAKAASTVLVAPSNPAVKKVSAKTPVVKKAASKVAAPITAKEPAKKAVAKAAVAKKIVAKKSVAKKAVAKKAVTKKAVTKKVTSKALITGKKPSTTGLPVRVKPVVNKLLDAVLKALEDMKAKDVVVLDVRNRTSITDDMVFASGTSTRHVKSLADSVAKAARDIKMPPIGVEGEQQAEWVLVDLSDVVVHVMLPKTREFYALERLWSSAGDGTGE